MTVMIKVDIDAVLKRAASLEIRRIQFETVRQMVPSSCMPLSDFQAIASDAENDHISIRQILGAFTQMALPERYLEIGVRRGHSLCMVAKCSRIPMAIYGFDLWVQDYAGEENPGPDLVRSEVEKFGFSGRLELISGDSRHTIPRFLEQHPSFFYLDMVFVDGDHSAEGARIDLENIIDHVAPGGILVFDDICHPEHLYLQDVWNEVMANRNDFSVRSTLRYEYGWAVAQKKQSDTPSH